MGLFACLGVAFAADKAIITNSNNDATDRGPGRYIVMGTKSVTVHGNAYTAPCASSDANLALSSQNGWSTGSAKDWNFGSHDLFWAAITGTNADTTASDSKNVVECTVGAGEMCTGVATYDVSSNLLSRYFHPTSHPTTAVNTDVLGNSPRAAAIYKAGVSDSPPGKIFSWNIDGSGNSEAMTSDHATQLAWVDGTFFVASAPGFQSASCGATHSPELQLWDASLTTGVKQASIAMPDNTDKPEGISVVPLNSGNHGSCTDAANYYAVYVASYCNDKLYVYQLHLTGSTSTFTLKRTVDLTTGSSFTGECNPSAVEYYAGTQKAYVVCQSRETIERIDAADVCAPSTTFAAESTLYYTTSTSAASCSVTPSLLSCAGHGEVNCDPHDIQIDDSIADGWLFVNLTGAHQTVAVRRALMDDEATFFSNFPGHIEPKSMTLGSTP